MRYQNNHKVIIAYRLEDKYGNSPFYYNGYKVVLPEGYYAAVLDITRFRNEDYKYSYYRLSLYEYALNITAQVYDTGEVLFRKEDIRSKSLIRR